MTGFPVAVVLAGLYWAIAVSGEIGKSTMFDEVAHPNACAVHQPWLFQLVTAPSDADDTCRAYLPMTPDV